MKKILFALIVTTVLFGCSSDDNSGSGGNNNFNPPNWIHGTWLDMSESGYKFTSNNVCQISSFNQICFKEMVDNSNATGAVEVSVDEEIKSNEEYKFSYTVAGVSQEYHFIKVSNTEIEVVSSFGVNPVLYKQ
jgi:hypothetical protein